MITSQYRRPVGNFFGVTDTSRINASEMTIAQLICRFSHSATKRLPLFFEMEYALRLSNAYRPKNLANCRNRSSGPPCVLNTLAIGENSPKHSVS
jgi:hypothetical protein